MEVRDSANYFSHPLSCSGPCTKNEQNVKETLQKYEHLFLQSKTSLKQTLESTIFQFFWSSVNIDEYCVYFDLLPCAYFTLFSSHLPVRRHIFYARSCSNHNAVAMCCTCVRTWRLKMVVCGIFFRIHRRFLVELQYRDSCKQCH